MPDREVVILRAEKQDDGFRLLGQENNILDWLQPIESQLHAINGLRSAGWIPVGSTLLGNGQEVPIYANSDGTQFVAIFERIEWCMLIDVEGFSNNLLRESSRALAFIRHLMQDMYLVGSEVYPAEHHRLFIHQLGDGFIVKPDFEYVDLLRPISIGIAVMRSALNRGFSLKISVCLGNIYDISGCYPEHLQAGSGRIGQGVMTVSPIMGGGIVKCHKLASREHGPLLLVDKSLRELIPDYFPSKELGTGNVGVNWLTAESEQISTILRRINPHAVENRSTEQMRQYLEEHSQDLRPSWVNNARLFCDSRYSPSSIRSSIRIAIRRYLCR